MYRILWDIPFAVKSFRSSVIVLVVQLSQCIGVTCYEHIARVLRLWTRMKEAFRLRQLQLRQEYEVCWLLTFISLDLLNFKDKISLSIRNSITITGHFFHIIWKIPLCFIISAKVVYSTGRFGTPHSLISNTIHCTESNQPLEFMPLHIL